MADQEKIFDRIDTAVLLAAGMDANNETPRSLDFDRPSHAAGVYLAIMHTYPLVRERFLGSGFLMLKSETKDELVRDSIKRLVRRGLLAGFDVPIPVMNMETKEIKTRMVRRYRPLSPLEALARLL